MMWYGEGAWSWGDWLAMSGMMLLFVAGTIGLTLWVVTSLPKQSTAPPRETPRIALDRRFANGEIDEEEYARARRLVEDQGTVSH